jgi:hypothetical protein
VPYDYKVNQTPLMTRIIAATDEFTYEMLDDQWVVIVDGEHRIRVTIPFDILRDLSEQMCQIPN